MATKKHSVKKSLTKKQLVTKSNNKNTLYSTCIGCKGKHVKILNAKEETFKGKGNKTRKRIVGTCENGHKYFRFIKS